jgi:hypothetical protein
MDRNRFCPQLRLLGVPKRRTDEHSSKSKISPFEHASAACFISLRAGNNSRHSRKAWTWTILGTRQNLASFYARCGWMVILPSSNIESQKSRSILMGIGFSMLSESLSPRQYEKQPYVEGRIKQPGINLSNTLLSSLLHLE